MSSRKVYFGEVCRHRYTLNYTFIQYGLKVLSWVHPEKIRALFKFDGWSYKKQFRAKAQPTAGASKRERKVKTDSYLNHSIQQMGSVLYP